MSFHTRTVLLPTPDSSSMQAGGRVRRLFVDSRDRVPNVGTAFDFLIDLRDGDETYRNISKISVLGFSCPKVAGEDYVMLGISEIPHGQLDLTSGNYEKAVDAFYFDSSVLQAGDVKPIEGQRFCPKIYEFNPPLASVSKLHIQILKHGGAGNAPTVITTNDTGGVTRVSLMLEITTHGRHG